MEITPSSSAAQFRAEMDDIRRRLAALETMRRTGLTTIHGGVLSVADDDGDLIARLGRFDVDAYDGGTVERLGFEVVDPDTGVVVSRSTLEDGATAPRHEVSWTPYDDLFRSTISATFEPLWVTRSTLWPSSAVLAGTNISTTGDPSTVWEARLKIGSSATGNFYTDVLSGTGTDSIVWQVDLKANGVPIGEVDPTFGLRFDLEARRVSGSGTVWTELPYPVLAWDATTEEASPGGL